MYTIEELEDYRKDIKERYEDGTISEKERDILLNQYQIPSDLEVKK